MSRRIASIAALVLAAVVGCQHGESAKRLTPRDQAELHLSRGEFSEALPLLERLHQQAPEDLELARALTEAHVKTGRVQDLIDQLQGRPQRSHSDLYMLGLAYFARAADASGPAIEAFRQGLSLAPNEPELHFRLGLALLESERYDDALPSLRRAAELAPQRGSYSLPLAKALYRSGDRLAAVATLRRVIENSPSPAEVRFARALMDQISDPFEQVPQSVRPRLEAALRWLHDQDVPQQAILSLEELAQEFPDLAILHALLGLAYQRLDDAGRAVEEFKRAIELKPGEGRSHLYLGQLYLSRQRVDQAQHHFQRAIELHPVLDEAYLVLGDLALERHELNRARALFQTLTHLQPESIGAKGKLSQVLQLQGDWIGAERQLELALQQSPDNLQLKLHLGMLYAEHHSQLSDLHARQRAAEKAARWLREVLREQPDNALASRALESVQRR